MKPAGMPEAGSGTPAFSLLDQNGVMRTLPEHKELKVILYFYYQIGAYVGKTAGGLSLDESWRENDGLVNTVSAIAPTDAPSKPLNENDIAPGIWNVFPTVKGDRKWLQGGLIHKHDIRDFYLKLLRMIAQLQGR